MRYLQDFPRYGWRKTSNNKDYLNHHMNRTDKGCDIGHTQRFFFSMQRRTKTWLRSTMGRKRYNSLSVLNAHTNILDNLSLIEVAEQFANIITGTQTNLGHLLKKIFMNIFSFFFMFFKKLGQSWTNILILVCIFKRLWAVLKNSRA